MSILYTAATGLSSAQLGLKVTSHNIANLGTEGFQRHQHRTDELTAQNGTRSQSVTRAEHFLQPSFLKANTETENNKVLFEASSLIEGSLTANGVSEAVNELKDAFNDYSRNPAGASKEVLSSAIEMIDSAIEGTQGSLSEYRVGLSNQYEEKSKELNSLLNGLKLIQNEIVSVSPSPGLLNKQDEFIAQISELTEVKVDNQHAPIKTLFNDQGSLTSADNAVGGLLGGISESIEKIDGVSTSLGDALQSFKAELDSVNSSGLNGAPLFAGDGSIQDVDLSLTNPGDNLNAPGFQDAISGFGAALEEIYVSQGSAASKARTSYDTSLSIRTNINEQIQSKTGVNLDEEAVNMVRYQQQYEALTKAIETDTKVFNSLLAAI